MDPSACWQRFKDALQERDIGEAVEAAVDLSGWLNSGGYEPGQWEHERITVKDWWGMFTVLAALFPDESTYPEVSDA